MKRAELARLSGYSERHISRIAAEIPGVKFSLGGQAEFDETNPKLQRWIAESHTRKKERAISRAAPRKRRLSKVPTMAEDLEAIERFVDAFNEFRVSGAKVRFTPHAAEFPEVFSYDQWLAGLKMLKHVIELPPVDRIILLRRHYGQSPPELFGKLAAAFMHPMFAALRDQASRHHK